MLEGADEMGETMLRRARTNSIGPRGTRLLVFQRIPVTAARLAGFLRAVRFNGSPDGIEQALQHFHGVRRFMPQHIDEGIIFALRLDQVSWLWAWQWGGQLLLRVGSL